ncbi:MAG TPA: hypothetical protein VFL86_28885 [Burkholderiaceae bacterium]|nr:hypothetical protein [Burkholderiaceae bacterium]
MAIPAVTIALGAATTGEQGGTQGKRGNASLSRAQALCCDQEICVVQETLHCDAIEHGHDRTAQEGASSHG